MQKHFNEKRIVSANGARTIGHPHRKKKILTYILNCIPEITQMNHILKYQNSNYETLRRKYRKSL